MSKGKKTVYVPVLCYLSKQKKTFLGATQQGYATTNNSLDLALAPWLVSFQCSVIPLGRRPATSFDSKQGTSHTSDKAKEDKGTKNKLPGL